MSVNMTQLLQGINLNDSRQPELYGAMISTYVLAVLAVGLRLLSRRLMKTQFWLDDWMVIVALVITTGLLVNSVIWIQNGLGMHFERFALGSVFTHFFQGLFIGEIMTNTIPMFVKFSILALTWRIFTHTTVRLPVWIFTFIVTSLGIAGVVGTILQCIPVYTFWDRNPAINTCGVDPAKFLVSISVCNIATEIACLLLPIPYILKLHNTNAQKAALCGMFLLGGFIIIISIIRLVCVATVDFDDMDVTWNFVYIAIWTYTEVNIAIVCACLPTLRPVFWLITTGSPHGIAYSRARRNTKTMSGSMDKFHGSSTVSSQHPFRALGETASQDGIELKGLTGLGQITVTQDIDIQFDLVGAGLGARDVELLNARNRRLEFD